MAKLFVYGSLMQKHKDKSISFPVYLEGYKISFKVKGQLCEPSFAMLEASANAKAHGIIIDLSKKALKKYIAHELSYTPKTVTVIDYEGNPHQSIALFLNEPGYDIEVMPSARYANLLYKGALYHGLPSEVTTYYLSLKETGNKYTYYLRFLTPLLRKLLPLVGGNAAYYGVFFALPLLALIALTVVISLGVKV